jgi:ankyrin repeat protein
MDAIEYLIANNADMNALTRTKMTMMHVAAQSDQVISLYFFKTKGLDINAVDEQNNTALHWAIKELSEIAVAYIMAWKPDFNIQDSDGNTPLNLAVNTVNEAESIRLVRFVAIRGADKEIANKEAKKPADLA